MTFDKLSSSLGSLLLIWARIERSAREEVYRSHGHIPKSAHGIAALIMTWQQTVSVKQPPTSLCPSLAAQLASQLKEPLDIRNGLCHGLIGIRTAHQDAPAKLSWEMNGSERSISWEELQDQLSWLSKAERALRTISDQSIERIGQRAVDNAENREWWRAEFDLELPSV